MRGDRSDRGRGWRAAQQSSERASRKLLAQRGQPVPRALGEPAETDRRVPRAVAASQHFRIQTQFAGTSPATLETGSPFLQDSALLGQAPPFGRGFGRFPAPSSGLQRAPQNHVYLRRAGRRPEALENSSPLRTAAAPSITSLTSAALYGRKDSSKQSLQRAGNSRPPAPSRWPSP